MYNRVGSYERKSISLETNEESQCLSWPLPFVVKRSEDILCSVMSGCEIHQRYQDTEEAQNVDNKNNDFDSRQSSTDKHVDEDAQHQNSPQE